MLNSFGGIFISGIVIAFGYVTDIKSSKHFISISSV